MLNKMIEKFCSMAPMWLAKLIDDEIPEIERYDDMAVLEYSFKYPMDLEAVMDIFEDDADLNILYHAVSKSDSKAHVCAICTPVGEYMHKVNVIGDENELVKGMTVTIYTSLEQMNKGAVADLELHEKNGFEFEYIMDDGEYTALFN